MLASKKFLVADDEIVENENDKEDFLLDLGVDKELGLFASNYEEALNIIESNPDIAICFVDFKIPKTQSIYNPENDGGFEWGIPLITKINQLIEDAVVVFYSSYVTKQYLQTEAKNFRNVAAFYGKSSGILQRKQLYLDAIAKSSSISFPKQKEILLDNLFNYGTLDENTRSSVRQKAEEIKFLIKRTGTDLMNIGKYLIEVKQSLRHGNYGAWLAHEGINYKFAARCMKTYKRFKSLNVTDLNFTPSVLYELSANKVSDEAINELVKRSRSGETITVKDAKSVKQKYIEADKEDNTELQKFKSNLNSIDIDLPLPAQDNKPQTIIEVIKRQDQWHLGPHTLVCCDPNSPKFTALLPENLGLKLCFPRSRDWQSKIAHYNSRMSFYSIYSDINQLPLIKSIRETIENTTNDRENIAVCFIPSPEIISLIDTLGCYAFVADPDYEICMSLVKLYKSEH